MTRRVVKLVERRTRDVRLPRADAAFLLAHARNVIDVQPGFAAGVYRLCPRGYVGVLDGPSVRFEIAPKLPWPNVLMLLGLSESAFAPGDVVQPASELLAAFARELADRLRDVARAGLVQGYREADRESPFLTGRLRTADQLRDAAARAFPDYFHITESVFDLDTPWNRVPKAVASALTSRPDLPADVRAELAAALAPLDAVPVRPVTEADFAAALAEPRAAAYNALLAVCRTIWDGFAAAGPAGDGGAFLIDLGRAFERHLADTVTTTFAGRPGWSVEAQPRFVLGSVRGQPVELQPDLIVRRRGNARAVLDAKWKRPGPEPADLHQILAYAAVTGAGHVGLVYPGRRFARRTFAVGRVRVSLFRLQVVGPVAACRAAGARLAAAFRGRPRRI